jgi:FKBP-type peptidyl-prolyl cis-trans isomerase FkpA
MSAVTAVPLRPLAKGSVLRLWLAIGLLVLIAGGIGLWGTSGLQRTAMPSGVKYQVLREGSGELISSADIVTLNFVGRHENGEVMFDTRRERPVQTTTDNFIPGVDEGLKLMRKGSVYRFWVPSYVWRGRLPPEAQLDPNETLSFDVQVMDVQPGAAARQRIQQMQDLQRQAQGVGNDAAPAPDGNVAVPIPAR